MAFESELTTERLRLVPCSHEHLDGLSAMNSDPEVMRYLTGRAQTRSETEAMIERVKRHWAKWGYSWWTFIERLSGAIVGAGCIQNLRREGAEPDPGCPLEIGWRLRRDQWGRGFATEGARAMAEFAFAQLRANVLYAVCQPENRASIAVMTRLGMHFRGVEDWYAQKVTTYEMTAADWHRARSGAP
jgi:RimJ/RimL family protein N-acetyltransferase